MGGVETYMNELIAGLVVRRPHLRVSVVVSPDAERRLADAPWADSVELVSHPLLGIPGTRAVAELSVVPWLASRLQVDLLHSLGMVSPAVVRSASVATIGDTI